MRIVFLVNRYWPAIGGVERYVGELAAALIGAGHTVSVVAGDHLGSLADREIHENVTVYRFPALRSPLRCCRRLMGLRRVFSEADVVHLCDTQMVEYFWRMIGWRPARALRTWTMTAPWPCAILVSWRTTGSGAACLW